MAPAAAKKPDYADLTLDELAVSLAPAVADAAVFDGWTDKAVTAAAELAGVDPDVARLAYGDGAMNMIAAWIESLDAAMAEAVPEEALQQMGFSDRIRTQLVFRLEHLTPQREAARRAQAVMAMPQNAVRSARLGWQSADLIWRRAGDTATDFNHYSKRAILASIYTATLLVFVNDDSEDLRETYAFLDRRLADVARFGKAKAQLTGKDRDKFSFTRLLGRLRYPAR